MKKLLLSSIIMLGICSFVTAQNATDAKSKKLAYWPRKIEYRRSAGLLSPLQWGGGLADDQFELLHYLT